ncbi:MAG TPA: DUF5110 domain-containing protein, partial [Candidatus Polarisedimenticolia bacterium]|nr:DUF5110 domain-containing protein [Candidatus Polarisedimenticolia bacterium]
DQAAAAMRRAFHLRSELFPYIYSSVRQSSHDSLPLLRSMYLEHPEDEKAYANAQQYYFGDAFLAAPITSPGEGSRKVATQTVWFPEGVWYNWFTGERYEGDLETVVAAEIDEIPLYVREGVPIPMQPYTPRMTTEPLERLVVRCYPGRQGRFVLYEDDGVTRDYERGAHATSELTCARIDALVIVSVGPVQGNYEGRPARRSLVIELAGTGRARAARIDGAPAQVDYDESQAVNRILVPELAPERGVTVEVEAPPIDFDALRSRASARRLEGVLGDRRLEAIDDPALLGTALGVLGVNVQRKNEGVYLHRGDDVLLVTDTFGVLQGPFTLSVEDRSGPRVEPVLQHDGTAQGTMRLRLPRFPLTDSPPVGFPWVRTTRLDFVMDGRRRSLSREIERRPSLLRRWSIAGPFPYTGKKAVAEQAFAPELGEIDLAHLYTLADGQTIGWRSAAAGADGIIDLRAAYDFSYRLAYGLTYLEADRQQQVTLKVWSDDAVELWLNGDKIHSNDIARPLGAEPDRVGATLRAGTNALLLKVANGLADWAFRVEIEARWPVRERER